MRVKVKSQSIIAVCVFSQLIGQSSPALAKASVLPDEKERICDIAQDGMAEVKFAKLAESKCSSPDVKKFASTMITDHTAANNKLRIAAGKLSIKLPLDVNPEQKNTFAELQKLKGAAFDRKYMDEMVKGHERAVKAIGDESEKGSGSLKTWAALTIGTIKQHDKLAKAIDTRVDQKE
jgi:putative membrane protein